MIQIYSADSRYTADHGWLKSKFSFSFAEYFDPNNMQFGPMRVLNDDIVQPNMGFGMHPHKEMEIVSVVLEGELQHQDSEGNTEVTSFGEIQRMSAGTGIMHSEMNPSSTEEVNFLQMWFLPEENGITPSYEVSSYDIEKLKNQLVPIVSKKSGPHVAHINQDLTMYLADIEAGNSISFSQEEGRRVFLFVIEGELTINEEHSLNRRDSARIEDTPQLKLTSNEGNRILLIDLP